MNVYFSARNYNINVKYREQDKNRISPDIYTLLRIHWLDTFITLGLDYNDPFSQGFIETFKWMNHYEYESESGLRNFLLEENTGPCGGHA